MTKRDSPKRKTGSALIWKYENALETKGLTAGVVRSFQKIICQHYQEQGRTFPWRKTRNPYRILVSEIMLQQTQVDRVVGKYEKFIAQFPDFSTLAASPLQKILTVWQGLGYNRRALALKKIAQTVVTEYNCTLPRNLGALVNLPGIGKTTASEILAFAFNEPTVFIETNIRSVFIHFFFGNKNDVKDAEILDLVEKTLDTAHPRKWYYALMDYGTILKKTYKNPSRKSFHYRTQSPFNGSNRQIRGMILKTLTREHHITDKELVQKIQMSPEKIESNLITLEKEGFIIRKGKRLTMA